MISFLLSFLDVLSIFCPVICILIFIIKWRIELSLDERIELFLLFEILLFILAVLSVPWEFPKITSYLEIYVVFFAVYPIMLFHRTRRLDFSFLYPLAGLMVFVAADVWEWGIFIFINPGQWFDQIHRIYALAVFYMLLKFSSWKIHWRSLLMLAATVAIPLFLIWLAPFPGWDFAVRGITLMLIGITVYVGVDSSE